MLFRDFFRPSTQHKDTSMFAFPMTASVSMLSLPATQRSHVFNILTISWASAVSFSFHTLILSVYYINHCRLMFTLPTVSFPSLLVLDFPLLIPIRIVYCTYHNTIALTQVRQCSPLCGRAVLKHIECRPGIDDDWGAARPLCASRWWLGLASMPRDAKARIERMLLV
jgi:hypothetical protein